MRISLTIFSLLAISLPVLAAPPAGQSYPYLYPVSGGTCESRGDAGIGETKDNDGNRVWRCVAPGTQAIEAKKIADTKIVGIVCPPGSQKYYDESGKELGCSIPATNIGRDAGGEITSVQCPQGSQPYYSKQSTLNKYTVGLLGEQSQFKTCITPPTKVTRAGELSTGKVSGEVKGYVAQVPIPCDPKLPGGCPSPATPAGYIARLYQFGLMIAGLAAFGAIIYGSLKYVLSAGNIGSQQDAREQITSAILGLVLLLGAFLILYTINPDLVNLRNPQLEFIDIKSIIESGRPAEELGEQRLIAGKGGAGDPLCKLAINTGITVGLTGTARTGQEIGELGQDVSGVVGEFLGAGGEKRGSACLNCKDNAHRVGAFLGVGGHCECNPGFGQYQDQGCFKPCPLGTTEKNGVCVETDVGVPGGRKLLK